MSKKFIIVLKSPCSKTLNAYCSYLKENLTIFNIEFSIFFLPVKKKIITLLKSPHVFKKAKDQYKFVTHKCVININNLPLNEKKKIIYLFINKPKSINLISKIQ